MNQNKIDKNVETENNYKFDFSTYNKKDSKFENEIQNQNDISQGVIGRNQK